MVRLKLQVIWGTTPVDVKEFLGRNTKWHLQKPKRTGEKQEKTGKNP
jgi:hypothetical protein